MSGFEAPKRYTATNDITGALIKSKADNQEAYASGWDRIFGKKNSEQEVTNGQESSEGNSFD